MEHVEFHKNPEVSDKINALFAYFNENTIDRSLGFKILLIKLWIPDFVEFSEFELAQAFLDLKQDLIRIRADKRRFKHRTVIFYIKFYYRYTKRKWSR